MLIHRLLISSRDNAPSPDNKIDAVPLDRTEQDTGVVMPNPLSTAVPIFAMILEAHPPPVTFAAILRVPAARPEIVNGLVVNGWDAPPSTVYVPVLPASRPVKLMVAVPSALPEHEAGVTEALPKDLVYRCLQ